jgi:hypothetical protein
MPRISPEGAVPVGEICTKDVRKWERRDSKKEG